jgi:transcriptional regulator with XRE-family HTH domain
LREWRGKRRMSQLELASEAEISTRHLSFLETGRSQASREMLLHLSEQLDIPLRERNVMLVAAGYAPVFEERPLASPEMAAARQAVERVLKGHEPFPALAIDRHWQLVSANAAVGPLLAGVDEALLKPSINVLRLSLQPSQTSQPYLESHCLFLPRLSLSRVAELERPRRYPKAFGTPSNLLSRPLRASGAAAPTHVGRKESLQCVTTV